MSAGCREIDYLAIKEYALTLPWVCMANSNSRSGSDAFHSYIEDHPNILNLPGHLFFYDFWNTANSLDNPKLKVWSVVIDEFIGKFITRLKSEYDVFENKHRLGDNRDQHVSVDLAEFRTHCLKLVENEEVSAHVFLQIVHIAYGLSRKQSIFEKKVVFYHAHSIDRVGPFLEDFPEAKIILLERDPRAAIVSVIEHRNRFDESFNSIDRYIYVYRRAFEWFDSIADHESKIAHLRLDDLNNATIMENVCKWMGVPYNTCLRWSTWGGLKWWGDEISWKGRNKSLDDLSGNIDQHEITQSLRRNSWQQKTSWVESIIFYSIFKRRLLALGYETRDLSDIVLVPISFFLVFWPSAHEIKFVARRLGRQPFGALFDFAMVYQRRIRLTLKHLFYRRQYNHGQISKFGSPSNDHSK